ncbi:hypothetical protein [Methylobacterium sp. D54C]
MTGQTGASGLNGAAWYSGTTAPAAGTGVVGDWYINTTTGDLYTKGSGGWGSPVINITAVSGALHYDVAQNLPAAQIAQALANLAIDGAETAVASAATTDIGAATTRQVTITGTTAISSFGTAQRRVRFIRFAGSLQLTHSAPSLILPGGANIVTQAGDSCLAISDTSGNWRVLGYVAAGDTAATVTFAPGLSVSSGGLSNAGATGRYRRIGQKLIWVEFNINIANNGSGAGSLSVALPFTAGGDTCILAGREAASTGKMLQGLIVSGATTMAVLNYDNTYPGANGYRLVLSGIYEVA